MAKSSKAQSDFGDDETIEQRSTAEAVPNDDIEKAVIVDVNVPGRNDVTSTKDLQEMTSQTMSAILSGPKTLPTGGDGTGGRPLVYCVTKERGPVLRQPQQGDQVRPMCPMCSNDAVAVLCTATSSPSHGNTFTTRYKCPKCTFSAQKLRPGALQQLQGRGMTPNAPFVERS